MLQTASLTIAELFSSPYLLNVPIYQRPYSWNGELAEQLYDDLIEDMSLDRVEDDDSGYFLGTILLMTAPGGETPWLGAKSAVREFDVVDGQQRLVTLMTLFAVLRDLEPNAKGAIARRTQGFATAQQGARFFRTERFRLQLTNSDRRFFETSVLQPGSTSIDSEPESLSQSEVALLGARNALRRLAGDLSPSARANLFSYVADQCHVVVILSNDIDRAYRLFVVLNERGRRLQRNEILKADVLSRLPASQVEQAAQLWDQASANLGADFEAFFAHIRTIYGFSRPQIVSGVRAVMQSAGGAEAFLKTVFLPLSDSYAQIRRGGDGALPPEIARRLFYLNRLADGDWAPAAMLALKSWRDEPDRALMLISEIDRFAHLMRLLCAGGGKRVRRFADLVAALRSGEALSPAHPGFQLTREETRSIGFHLKDIHTRNPKACKLLLLRLSDEMSGQMADVAPEAYTIEHVLPQRPSATSEWRRWYPTPEERGQCVASLGNLALITQSQNDKARNATWAAKKRIYEEATKTAPLLPITRDVLSAVEWRRTEVEAREEKLIRIIERIWRIDLAGARSAGRSAAE
ncbi:MAG: DUF262 domain-containing protein [Hyphomicrobium sp.]